MAAPSSSSALTRGIRITVQSRYLPEQSSPAERRYVFAYTIRIENEGSTRAQLRSRHWVITDGNGETEEVRGPGVVGKQPVIEPGGAFEYTSGCVLKTARGAMRGSYQMTPDSGEAFDAEIASFTLSLPHSLN
jgi:ApaG protein